MHLILITSRMHKQIVNTDRKHGLMGPFFAKRFRDGSVKPVDYVVFFRRHNQLMLNKTAREPHLHGKIAALAR